MTYASAAHYDSAAVIEHLRHRVVRLPDYRICTPEFHPLRRSRQPRQLERKATSTISILPASKTALC